jgi:hypothetical protein
MSKAHELTAVFSEELWVAEDRSKDRAFVRASEMGTITTSLLYSSDTVEFRVVSLDIISRKGSLLYRVTLRRIEYVCELCGTSYAERVDCEECLGRAEKEREG